MKPRIIITVMGGLIAEIRSTVYVDIQIKDLDVKKTSTFHAKLIKRRIRR